MSSLYTGAIVLGNRLEVAWAGMNLFDSADDLYEVKAYYA